MAGLLFTFWSDLPIFVIRVRDLADSIFFAFTIEGDFEVLSPVFEKQFVKARTYR
jgi:hypothetical protein